MITARPAIFLAGTSLAAALLAGCSGVGGIKSANAAMPETPLASSKGNAKLAKAVVRAESEVASRPNDVAARTALGQAYLAAGRFASAATALDDAMALGDNSGRTALALALAKLGSGNAREAVAILDDWRGEIPAGDLGLALALSGETSRGVAVLADALRNGENTPKLRQNLAYAYALDGRWTEAKLMAAQDVPADELDKRLAFWALSMLPDRNVDRVAALIGAPATALDPGQPAALALNIAPAIEAAPQLAVAEPAEAPAPSLPVAPAGELAPAKAPATTTTAAPAPALTVLEQNAVAQRQPAVRIAPAEAARPVRKIAAAATAKPARDGNHFVQLGAFSSAQGARRAWDIFTRRDPGLAAYRMTITPAVVHGKAVWRVAAGGLSGRGAATSLCSKVKSSGGACFAYAGSVKATPVPAAPQPAGGGAQRARR